jgi:hypothetical protein
MTSVIPIAVTWGLTMRFAVPVLGVFLAACSVGEFGTDGGAANNVCAERVTPPLVAHIHLEGGGTNAGMGCVVAACHLAAAPGLNAPGYQFGGTVYKPGIERIPSAGVTVRIKGKDGMIVAAVTDDAGNFYIPAGALADPFPAAAVATACPTMNSMVATLSQGGGNCNSGDCHGGTQLPIYVEDPP